MRKQVISPNLTVIDTSSIVPVIERQYYQFLLDDSALKDKERKKLYLYFTYKTIVEMLASFNNRKDVIFYVNLKNENLSFQQALNTLTKTFPIIVHEGEANFECLNKGTGESIELESLVRNKRFMFDYSRFSKRKMDTFLKYRGIKLQFPT
jgi:hypothetical protein